jgi:hypothetical protein
MRFFDVVVGLLDGFGGLVRDWGDVGAFVNLA